MAAPAIRLPGGFAAGHHTDRDHWTGCTALLAPPGAIGAAEVRGGGPGTRESDILTPASSPPGVNAVLLTGGSAYGLGAAEGVVRHLDERGIGFPTPEGLVPLVAAGVVYDLWLGGTHAPSADDAYAACRAASDAPEPGSVGAGTGCTVGKLLGHEACTKGGLGLARVDVAGAAVAAIAAANSFGEVVGEDGAIMAGAWRDGRYAATLELLRDGHRPPFPRESTTLACVLTDARLDKTQAWLVARAANSGVARAVRPSATAVDGDVVWCIAAGEVEADPFAISTAAAEATAAAIRDAVSQATGAPGVPAARERERTTAQRSPARPR